MTSKVAVKPKVKRARRREGPAIDPAEFLALKKPKGDLILEIEGERVSLTSLDRIYWPKEKITKFDLLCYYLRIAPQILPFLKDRPAILQRYPRGVGAVNLGTIEQHPWHSTLKHLDKPDYFMLDLDPKEAPWKNVLEVALVCKKVFDELGLPAFPRTSGSSGIHIYLPLKPKYSYGKVAGIAAAFAAEVAQRAPKIATVQRSLAKRQKQQVYVDAMQNARGKTIASPYSARAKPGATVSMPLTWKQIEKGVQISDFTIRNVPELIAKNGDEWQKFFGSQQSLKL